MAKIVLAVSLAVSHSMSWNDEPTVMRGTLAAHLLLECDNGITGLEYRAPMRVLVSDESVFPFVRCGHQWNFSCTPIYANRTALPLGQMALLIRLGQKSSTTIT